MTGLHSKSAHFTTPSEVASPRLAASASSTAPRTGTTSSTRFERSGKKAHAEEPVLDHCLETMKVMEWWRRLIRFFHEYWASNFAQAELINNGMKINEGKLG